MCKPDYPCGFSPFGRPSSRVVDVASEDPPVDGGEYDEPPLDGGGGGEPDAPYGEDPVDPLPPGATGGGYPVGADCPPYCPPCGGWAPYWPPWGGAPY